MFVFNLICEDASHLGGPMGTEYTTHLWTKTFSSVDKAKAYAEKYCKKEEFRWEKGERGKWFVDARTHIFTIERQTLKI